jgi:hypothetical protein
VAIRDEFQTRGNHHLALLGMTEHPDLMTAP